MSKFDDYLTLRWGVTKQNHDDHLVSKFLKRSPNSFSNVVSRCMALEKAIKLSPNAHLDVQIEQANDLIGYFPDCWDAPIDKDSNGLITEQTEILQRFGIYTPHADLKMMQVQAGSKAIIPPHFNVLFWKNYLLFLGTWQEFALYRVTVILKQK